jgi:4-hydroxybenzoate polyprenyltransferase
MSFQEKSLWLVFLSVIAFSGFYFSQALPGAGRDVMPGQVALFVVAIVVLVIAQVAGHIVIAIVDRRTDTDERDGRIALKGTRNGAYVLATGVFLALCAGLVTEGNFVFMHVLLGFWVLAQLVEIGSQLFMHRRGA